MRGGCRWSLIAHLQFADGMSHAGATDLEAVCDVHLAGYVFERAAAGLLPGPSTWK